MLNYDDIEAAIPLAQEITAKKTVLEVKPGPLAFLNTECNVAISSCSAMTSATGGNIEEHFASVVSLLHEASASITRTDHGPLLDTSHHDVKVSDVSALIASGVLATVARVRTVAIPLIKRLEESVAEGLLGYENRGVQFIAIDEIGVGGVLDNDSVYDYFEEYSRVRVVPLPTVAAFPKMDDIQLAGLIQAGDPDLNELFTDSITASSSQGGLGQFVYGAIYQGAKFGAHADVDLYSLRGRIRTFFGEGTTLTGLMLGYYFAKGLIESVPDGVDANIAELTRRVDMISKSLGGMIFAELAAYRKSLKDKILLPVGYPYVDRNTGDVDPTSKIRVNREIYAGYLADGGTPEAIYGAMVSDKATSISVLLADKDKYEKAYQRFFNLNRSNTNSSLLSVHVRALTDEFYKAVEDTDELKAMDKSKGLFTRMRDRLNRLGADDIASPEKLYSFIRSLVCYSLYPEEPQVEKVISDIDNFEQIDDSVVLSTSEIACYVLIDLIVDWLSKQLVLRAV